MVAEKLHSMSSRWNHKLWYLLLLALSAYGCSSSCSRNSGGNARKANSDYQMNWQKFSLQGQVKSLQETEDKPAGPGSRPINLEQLWFDPAGNVTRNVTAGAGDYYGDKRYKYDGVGNPLEVEYYERDNTLKFTAKNTFDTDGNLVEYLELTKGTRLTHKRTETYVKYTPEEHVLEVRQVIPPSSPSDVAKYVTRFDAQGRKTQVEFSFGSNGPVSDKTLYQYNPDGTVEETTHYYRDGSDTVARKGVTLFDAAHRVLSIKYVNNDRPEDSVDESFQYDPAGNIIEYKRSTPKGLDLNVSYRNDYEYDSQGNWTRRVTSSLNREFRNSVVRRIEY
jgi:hypothetical protein